MQSTNESLRGTYVVTYDVASRLQSFRSDTLSVPSQNDPMFESFHLRLFELLEQALPGVTINTIEMSELRRKIWEQVRHRIDQSEDVAVLSTCPEIASATTIKGETLLLNINRLFNVDGEIIGHGPRPGFEFLEKQFDELARKIAGRPVILIEDGAFTGGTLRSVLEELHTRGIEVPTVIIGFCCTRAKALLKEVFKGELVIVNPIEDLIDWIPDHDLIPFIPNCGRVLGEKVPHSFVPIETAEGVSCAYPYILPFGKIEEWASLPTDGAKELSRFCLDTAIGIFDWIGVQSGHAITVGELLKSNPRVSIPVLIDSDVDNPSLKTEVVVFLKNMRERLSQ
jgi:hypothetical protein